MTDLVKRLAVLFLVLLLLLGAPEYLLMTTVGTNHIAQEATCPIHGGVVQPERAQPLVCYFPVDEGNSGQYSGL